MVVFATAKALLLLLLIGVTRAAEPPAFVSELWPGEGPLFFAVKTEQIVLRKEPSRSSVVFVRTLKVRPGSQLRYDQTRYITIRSGSFVALVSGTLDVMTYGRIRYLSSNTYYHRWSHKKIAFVEGLVLEYLHDRAEGSCILRLNDEIFAADICPEFDQRFKLTLEPVTEWWMRVVIRGKPIGWLLMDEDTVQFLNRQP